MSDEGYEMEYVKKLLIQTGLLLLDLMLNEFEKELAAKVGSKSMLQHYSGTGSYSSCS
jgi:hypothetical protein